jgi:hypothetical protein
VECDRIRIVYLVYFHYIPYCFLFEKNQIPGYQQFALISREFVRTTVANRRQDELEKLNDALQILVGDLQGEVQSLRVEILSATSEISNLRTALTNVSTGQDELLRLFKAHLRPTRNPPAPQEQQQQQQQQSVQPTLVTTTDQHNNNGAPPPQASVAPPPPVVGEDDAPPATAGVEASEEEQIRVLPRPLGITAQDIKRRALRFDATLAIAGEATMPSVPSAASSDWVTCQREWHALGLEDWRGKPQAGWSTKLKSAFNKRVRIQDEVERFANNVMQSEVWAAARLELMRKDSNVSFTNQLTNLRKSNNSVKRRASRGELAPKRRRAKAAIVSAQRNAAESTAVQRLRARQEHAPRLLAGRTRPLTQPTTPDGTAGRQYDAGLRAIHEMERRERERRYIRLRHDFWKDKSPQAHLDQELIDEFRSILARHDLVHFHPRGNQSWDV